MSKTQSLKAALAAILCTIALIGHARADESKQIDVPAGDLIAALETLVKQSGVELVYQAKQLKGIHTSGVRGTYSAQEAVLKLLEGTELVIKKDESGAILITRPSETPTQQKQTATKLEPADSDRPGGETSSSGSSVDLEAESARKTPKSGEESPRPTPQVLQEILVTGSHIVGESPAGSKMIVIDRDYVERSGQSTLQDVLNTLPQAGPAPSALQANGGDTRIQSNDGYASGFNLHGINAGATLVLVDGRRQTTSGLDGAFVDIANIPLSAVERIEVMADGASAIYGSDAIAGVVNIILKKNFTGIESRVRFSTKNGDGNELNASQLFGAGWGSGNAMLGLEYLERRPLLAADRAYSANGDQTSFGGANSNSYYSNPGNILDPVTGLPAFAIPAGQTGIGLTPDQLIDVRANQSDANFMNRNAGLLLFPDEKSASVFANVAQRWGERVEFSASARFNRRPISSKSAGGNGVGLSVTPRNPFYVDAFNDQSTLSIAYDLSRDIDFRRDGTTKTYEGGLGLTLGLPQNWTLATTLSYSRQTLDFTYITSNGLLDEALGNYSDPNDPNAIDDPATAYNPLVDGFFNPFGDGSHSNAAVLAALQTQAFNASTWQTYDANAILNGSIFSLSGGAARLALGAEYKRDEGSTKQSTSTVALQSERQSSKAAFVELSVPFFGKPNERKR